MHPARTDGQCLPPHGACNLDLTPDSIPGLTRVVLLAPLGRRL
ncbi:hypothetical protein SXCC_01061 [Gluconacetobacter sp. SXCC-1]|nr:hypothetical protein SXCC_01061 [Gluconacetobacter sp. SXCC-1]